MDSFSFIWDLLIKHGNVAWKYKDEAQYAWSQYSIEEQRVIYQNIKRKLASGLFVSYIPNKAILDNAPKNIKRTLSYNEYFEKFHTTEEVDGWRRVFIPEKRCTIYVKGR